MLKRFMGNVLRILMRDLLRLLKAPAALIVVGALLVLPSIYTWYNVVAFWDPYEATGNLKVCVVNQDAGTENELTGKLNVGDKVTEELLKNDKLDFTEGELDSALDDLKSGGVYAVYEIPEDFSECLVSPVTGEIKTPQIKYYANEKLGPVSPKITDTAANTLDQTINSMFVSTVTEAAVKAVDEAVQKAETDVDSARTKATTRTDKAKKAIAKAREKLESVQTTCNDAKEKAASASIAMEDAFGLTADARAVLSDISSEASAAQESLSKIATNSISALSLVIVDVSKVTAKASTAADGLVSKAGTAQSHVDLAAGRIQPVIDAMTEVANDLTTVANDLPDDMAVKSTIADAAQDAADRAARLQALVNDVQTLSSNISDTAQAASDTASTLEQAAQQIATALQNYSDDLYGNAAPAINSSLGQVSVTCERLSSATSNLDTTIQQAQASLNQLSGLLGDCGDAVGQTNKVIGGLQDDLDSLSADVNLLAESGVVADIVKNGSLNSQSIGSFMGSPTKLKTEKLYAPNAYGTAMAPLFMNLTFWIGAFMLVIICKLEVDDEGIEKITPGQRYLSRFLLFAGIAVIQALICCTGVLALGVQVANVPALYLAAACSSLAYLSVIYMLSTTLQHIGKALCIVLVFAQIPGGSGLYPLELTDSFFQTIYPFLPFSYGINALREAICGFYGNFYVYDLAVLGVIFITTLILGMVLTPLMSNVIRMAARQIHEGDLYNGEEAVVPERQFRLSQMVSALNNRDEFREDLERRYARFNKMYPAFIRAALVLGIGVPVVLAALLALDAGEKVALLTALLLWLVFLIVFLVIVESMRYSFERQTDMGTMSQENLLKQLFNRNSFRPAFAGASGSAGGAGDTDSASADVNAAENAGTNGTGVDEGVVSLAEKLGFAVESKRASRRESSKRRRNATQSGSRLASRSASQSGSRPASRSGSQSAPQSECGESSQSSTSRKRPSKPTPKHSRQKPTTANASTRRAGASNSTGSARGRNAMRNAGKNSNVGNAGNARNANARRNAGKSGNAGKSSNASNRRNVNGKGNAEEAKNE